MRDLSAVDLNLLVALELLLEERSVRGAARRAHVTPSAMSHTLGRLRELLDDELFVRAGRRMVPTPRAESLASPVADVLARARWVLSENHRFDPQRLERRFRVVCTDHVSTVLLDPALRRIRREAPAVDLVVAPLTPNTMEELRHGEVDAAIGVFPEAPPEMRMRGLFTDRFVTVWRAGHPRLHTLDLSTYLEEPHVLVAPRGVPVGLVDQVLAEQHQHRRVARAFPSFLAALWHVSRSDELLTISERLVEAVAPRLSLRSATPPLSLPEYRLVLAWHPRTGKSREDVWFRDLLADVADTLPMLPRR